MRLTTLLREALAALWAQRVPTVMTAALVAAMCLTTALTVGQTAAAEARLDEAGARQLQIADPKRLGFLSDPVLAVLTEFDTIERVVGLDLPIDVVNTTIGPGAVATPAWHVHGDLRAVVDLAEGRWPGPGEALVSATALDRLGFEHAAGAVTAVDGTTIPVVGSFTPRPPYEDLRAGLAVAVAPGTPAHRLDIILTTAEVADETQSAVLALLNRPDPRDLDVTSPMTLAEARNAVLGDLAAANRSLVLLVLVAGGTLVTVVVLADVLLRRVDLGRRRALGAPRWGLVCLVTLRATFAAALGAVVGTVAAVVLALRGDGLIDPSFTLATAVLSILTATAAAIPPAVVAARQDPVRILRTP